jgi:hypothetical protein
MDASDGSRAGAALSIDARSGGRREGRLGPGCGVRRESSREALRA